MNKNNDDLLTEIIHLKRNLNNVEKELKRVKKEKDARNFYIKELERELLKLNIENNLNNNNLKNFNDNEAQKRNINSVKMRDFGKYQV